jgi:hypothetical protein
MTTITKRITDMSKYGISGEYQWQASIVTETDNYITASGKYFSTREQAEAYTDTLIKEMK